MIKCLCIDDSNRPVEIPVELWVIKGNEYHIAHIYFHHVQFISGVELHELELTDECFPYESYKLSRFAFSEQGLLELVQMMKDCSELDEVDVLKMLERENVLTPRE